MTDMIFDVLMNNGAIGLLAGYLLYQNNESRRLQLETQEKLYNKLEEFAQLQIETEERKEQKFEKKETELRYKYDNVIEKLDAERKQIIDTVAKSIEGNILKTDQLNESMKALTLQFTELTNRLIRLNEKLQNLESKVNTLEGSVNMLQRNQNK